MSAFRVQRQTILTNYRGINIQFVDFGGGVTSDSLFCDKEQPIFDFYLHNKDRYRRALDIGANVGVHSMLMARSGWDVRAYEPDPETYKMARTNIIRGNDGWDGFNGITIIRSAVSDHSGRSTFVRVKGNTTGSHLEGDKAPYGPLERFQVDVVDCRPLFDWADFAKIDCEGGEARILLTVRPEQRCEFMVEVGSEGAADAIFMHFRQMFPAVRMWAQQADWREVVFRREMPTHHSHGALFIGREPPIREVTRC